jgi:predicted nucleic acid-binding protein
LVTEPSSEAVNTWLERHTGDRFVVSDWVVAEFSAALGVKLSSKRMTADDRERALERLADILDSEFECLPVLREHFRQATAFANRSFVGLRAGDALHLALAANHAIKLCTRDRLQAQAGAGLGILTELVP